MKRFSINWRHLLGAVLALAVSSAASVRADYAYAFASQTLSNVALTATSGSIVPTSAVTTGTSDSATLAGFSGVANSDPTDAPQAYVGTPPPAPQNDFAKWATGITGAAGQQPTGPGPFSRGDVAILSANSAANVAESYTTQGSGTASGAFSAAFAFNATAGTVLSLSYNFANDLYTSVGGNGSAQAGFKFDVTIKDSAGNVVFDSAPSLVNVSVSSPPNSAELVGTGTISANTATLAAGSYTMVFSGSETTFVNANSVPEPSSLLMGGIAVGLVGGVCGWRNRKARLQA